MQPHQPSKDVVQHSIDEPDPVSKPIEWRRWWMAKNPGKTWDHASKAWLIRVN